MAAAEHHSEELDLSVSNMGSPALEEQARALLEDLPGIKALRLVERGIWIRYLPRRITADEILVAIRRAGFHAAIFQDSASGRTGSASF